MEFLTEFPSLGRSDLSAIRRAIDGAFRDFTRAWGESIEAFFNPLLRFLVWFEDVLLATPWPLIILILCGLAWAGSRVVEDHHRHCNLFRGYWHFRHVGRHDVDAGDHLGRDAAVYCPWASRWGF